METGSKLSQSQKCVLPWLALLLSKHMHSLSKGATDHYTSYSPIHDWSLAVGLLLPWCARLELCSSAPEYTHWAYKRSALLSCLVMTSILVASWAHIAHRQLTERYTSRGKVSRICLAWAVVPTIWGEAVSDLSDTILNKWLPILFHTTNPIQGNHGTLYIHLLECGAKAVSDCVDQMGEEHCWQEFYVWNCHWL